MEQKNKPTQKRVIYSFLWFFFIMYMIPFMNDYVEGKFTGEIFHSRQIKRLITAIIGGGVLTVVKFWLLSLAHKKDN